MDSPSWIVIDPPLELPPDLSPAWPYEPKASPEDVLVAVSGGPSSEDLIRRGSRLARRLGGTCMVVTVQSEATPSSLR